jgi:hypothetical protein
MNVHTILKKAYNGFSTEMHENANVNDKVQLAVFIHGINMTS